MRSWSIIFVVGFILTGCGGSGSGGSSNSIPTVKIECSGATLSDCSQDGKYVFVGLIESLTLDCASTLKNLTASQRQQLFTASGDTTSTRSGIDLVATVSNWVNSTGGGQDVLNPGNYQACALIDTNGNGLLDAGEPVGSGQVSTGTGQYILNSWTSTP